jgi:hypothetical protein
VSELAINAGTSESIIEVIRGQGIMFSTRMEINIPSMPDDLTELDDEGLMQVFAELTAYANFLSAQYSCALIDEKNAEQSLDLLESKKFIDAHELNKKETITLTKARLSVDPEIIALREAVSAKYAYKKLIEVMVNNIDRNTQLVSRELTRRTSSFNKSTRMFP